jgi:hypothetical protein
LLYRSLDDPSHENNRLAIGWVSVAAGGAFDVLGVGVVASTLLVVASDVEDFDLLSPSADSAVELVCLRPAGILNRKL